MSPQHESNLKRRLRSLLMEEIGPVTKRKRNATTQLVVLEGMLD